MGYLIKRREAHDNGRPKKPIILSDEEREQLSAIVNSRSLPHGLVRRARIILLAAEGISNNTIGERVGVSHQTVCQWRQRYLQQGLEGLHDELVQAGRDRYQMKKSPGSSARQLKPNRKMELIGLSGRYPTRPDYPAPRCTGYGGLLDFSPIVSVILSSPQTRSLLKKSGIL